MTMAQEVDLEEELEEELEYVVVAPHQEMDDEMLLKHINARHMPLGGMKAIPSIWNRHSEPIELWREYHAQVHALGLPYGVAREHVHEDPQW